jgi:3D (Asp-Asp-Asp) domain-containing protein
MNKWFSHKKRKNFFQSIGLSLTVLLTLFGSYIISPSAAKALSLDNLNPVVSYSQLPVAGDSQPRQVFSSVPVTAYSSEVGQTDASPFVTASGTTVRRGVVAANFLPIGTCLRFPELYGDEVFIVEDRMNDRYNYRIDIWMDETVDAKNFGVYWTTIEVF